MDDYQQEITEKKKNSAFGMEGFGTCWRIEPHKSDEYDYCLMEAKTDDNHRDALTYAQEVLEQQWDEMVDNIRLTPTVTMMLVKISEAEAKDYDIDL